jgi:hypothetical protein
LALVWPVESLIRFRRQSLGRHAGLQLARQWLERRLARLRVGPWLGMGRLGLGLGLGLGRLGLRVGMAVLGWLGAWLGSLVVRSFLV